MIFSTFRLPTTRGMILLTFRLPIKRGMTLLTFRNPTKRGKTLDIPSSDEPRNHIWQKEIWVTSRNPASREMTLLIEKAKARFRVVNANMYDWYCVHAIYVWMFICMYVYMHECMFVCMTFIIVRLWWLYMTRWDKIGPVKWEVDWHRSTSTRQSSLEIILLEMNRASVGVKPDMMYQLMVK